MNAIDHLNDLENDLKKAKYPGQPYLVPANNRADSANALTKAVIKLIQLTGNQAERVSVEGRTIDERVTYTDVLGKTRTIGSVKRIPSSMTKGSADISATIAGRSVKIEIKWGKDRQSEAQQKYQRQVEAAGGVYIVVHTFEEFTEWYYRFIGEVI